MQKILWDSKRITRAAIYYTQFQMQRIAEALEIVIQEVPKKINIKLLFSLSQLGPEFEIFKSNKLWHCVSKKKQTYHSYARLHKLRSYQKHQMAKSRDFAAKIRKRHPIKCDLCAKSLKRTVPSSAEFSAVRERCKISLRSPNKLSSLSRKKPAVPYCWLDSKKEIGLPWFLAQQRNVLLRLFISVLDDVPVVVNIKGKSPVCLECVYCRNIRKLW